MQKTELDLWLIRHGQSTWNVEGRTQGQQNPPLTPLGEEQAKRLRPRLANLHFDVVYSSDLARAAQTAQIASPTNNICYDKRLREISRGIYEGKTPAERSPEEQQRFKEIRYGSFSARYESGESMRDVIDRVFHWLEELPEQAKVLAFSHGGTISAIFHELFASYGPISFDVVNSSISRVIFRPENVRVMALNDAAHLSALETGV